MILKKIKSGKTGRQSNKESGNRLLLAGKSYKYFEFNEAYKALRTNIQFTSIGKDSRKILVTSSIPGEGKTTVAVHLSISLAELGQKVLLIDTDLRRPQLYRYLGVNRNAGGLTSILAELNTLENSVFALRNTGVFILPSGPVPPNPAELLGSHRFHELMEILLKRFDYLVFDTPPASLVTDAAVLSTQVDDVLFVVRHNYTPMDAAMRAKANLERAGANVIGCVLNYFSSNNEKKKYYKYNLKYRVEELNS